MKALWTTARNISSWCDARRVLARYCLDITTIDPQWTDISQEVSEEVIRHWEEEHTHLGTDWKSR